MKSAGTKYRGGAHGWLKTAKGSALYGQKSTFRLTSHYDFSALRKND